MGVRNRWAGKWTGTVEWTMELLKHISEHNFFVAILSSAGSYLLTNLLIANSALHYTASCILLKVTEIKGLRSNRVKRDERS